MDEVSGQTSDFLLDVGVCVRVGRRNIIVKKINTIFLSQGKVLLFSFFSALERIYGCGDVRVVGRTCSWTYYDKKQIGIKLKISNP